jgi:hypothetical protein
MTARAPRVLHLLGAVFAGLLGCDGSPLHVDGAADGPKSDGPHCSGQPVDCVQGGEATCTPHGWVCPDAGVDAGCAADARTTCVQGTVLGDFAACADVVTFADCVNGQWTCPVGSIDPGLCRCDGAPSPGCTCTKQGWSCREGGTDARPDTTDADGSSCIGPNPNRCVQAGRQGAIVVCNDVSMPSICVNGEWTCEGGPFVVDVSLCTCSGAVPPGCRCSVAGWVCNDGGVDASPADASATDASCEVGCTVTRFGSFCQAGEVQWVCQSGGYDAHLFNTACRDPGTNLQRYCCPPSFLAMCQ